MKGLLSVDSVVVAAREQVSCKLEDEAAILNLASGVYYGLDPVGARIWHLIQQPRSVQEVLDTLLDHYEVERERCARDLLALLQKLLAEGLVKVIDETTRQVPESPTG